MQKACMRFGLILGVFSLCVCLLTGVVLAGNEDLLSAKEVALRGLETRERVESIPKYPLLSSALHIPKDFDLNLGQGKGQVLWSTREDVGQSKVQGLGLSEQRGRTLGMLLFEIDDGGVVSQINASRFVWNLASKPSLRGTKTLEQTTPEGQVAPPPYYVVVERIEADVLVLETPQGMLRVSRDILPSHMLEEGCVFEIRPAIGERRRRLSEASDRIERMQGISRASVKEGAEQMTGIASDPVSFDPKS